MSWFNNKGYISIIEIIKKINHIKNHMACYKILTTSLRLNDQNRILWVPKFTMILSQIDFKVFYEPINDPYIKSLMDFWGPSCSWGSKGGQYLYHYFCKSYMQVRGWAGLHHLLVFFPQNFPLKISHHQKLRWHNIWLATMTWHTALSNHKISNLFYHIFLPITLLIHTFYDIFWISVILLVFPTKCISCCLVSLSVL